MVDNTDTKAINLSLTKEERGKILIFKHTRKFMYGTTLVDELIQALNKWKFLLNSNDVYKYCDSNNGRCTSISLHASREQYNIIKKYASMHNMPIGKFCREILLRLVNER